MTRSPRRHAPGAAPRLFAVVAALLLAVAACAGGATPSAAGPSPTGSLVPAVTATPGPSAAPVGAATPAAAPSAAAATTYPLALADDEGTVVNLPSRPERIVSLTPATTEILFALGAGDRVVGATDVDDYPEAAKSVTRVVAMGAIDIEKIVGLGADLVVAGGNNFNSPAALAKLRGLGIPVLVVYAPDVAGVLHDIELVGTAAGEGPAAAALAARMRTEIEAIGSAVAGAGTARPRVFYELDATKEIFGPADDSFVARMIRLAGGDPITTGSTTVFSIPLETLLTADPQVIVLGDAAYGVTAEQVAARPGWSAMTAVRTGAVRPVDNVVVTRPGPRLVEGLRALALAIDPGAQLPSVAP